MGEIVNINVGEMYIAERPATITTLLGSCVAVCLWDRRFGIGAMNHYLLPVPPGPDGTPSCPFPCDYRYGNLSIETMVQKLFFAGARRETIVAKIFGGGNVIYNDGLDKLKGNGVGNDNIKIAEEMLKDIGISIVARDTGGAEGRKVVFNTGTGQVLVRRLNIEKMDEKVV